MPIQSVTFNSKLISQEPKQIERSIVVLCHRDELVSDKRLKARLREELIKLPEKFDIHPHIMEVKNCISRINFVVVNIEVPNLVESAAFLYRLIKPALDGEREPCLMHLDKVDSYSNGQLDVEHLPLGLIEMVMNLAFKKQRIDRDGNIL